MTRLPCTMNENRSRFVGVSAKHIAGCPDCRETERVSAWMQRLERHTSFPDTTALPGLLLFKARLLERRNAQSRAAMPILSVQAGSIGLGSIIIAWIFLSSPLGILPNIQEAFRSLSKVNPYLVLGGMIFVMICSAIGYLLFGNRVKGGSSDLHSR